MNKSVKNATWTYNNTMRSYRFVQTTRKVIGNSWHFKMVTTCTTYKLQTYADIKIGKYSTHWQAQYIQIETTYSWAKARVSIQSVMHIGLWVSWIGVTQPNSHPLTEGIYYHTCGHEISAGINSSLSTQEVESELSDDIGDVATPNVEGTTSWMAPAQ